jgi:Rrf2 family protein
MLNSKLTVSIHILTLLALAGKTSLTSEAIAESVNTNPVVIRRLLGSLRNSGLVKSHSGPKGGWQLKCPADEITLFDVRQTVDPDHEFFPLHYSEPNPLCPVGGKIQGALDTIYCEVVRVMDQKLADTTIEEVLRSLQNPRFGTGG